MLEWPAWEMHTLILEQTDIQKHCRGLVCWQPLLLAARCASLDCVDDVELTTLCQLHVYGGYTSCHGGCGSGLLLQCHPHTVQGNIEAGILQHHYTWQDRSWHLWSIALLLRFRPHTDMEQTPDCASTKSNNMHKLLDKLYSCFDLPSCISFSTGCHSNLPVLLEQRHACLHSHMCLPSHPTGSCCMNMSLPRLHRCFK